VTVLDTHAWVWWASDPRKLSARARRAVEAADRLGVCAISCWEVAMLVARGRLVLDREALVWLKQALALPRIDLLPIGPAIAVAAAALGEDFPGDPADRLIAATTLEHKAKLVTKDRRIRSFGPVPTVW